MSMVLLAARVVLSLGATIGIILLFSKIYQKRMVKGTRPKPKQLQNLVIKSRISIGKSSQIALVEFGEHSFIVGITPSNISLISKIEAESNEKSSHEALDATNLLVMKPQKRQGGYQGEVIDLTDDANQLSNNSLEDLTAQIRQSQGRSGTKLRFEEALATKLSQSLFSGTQRFTKASR